MRKDEFLLNLKNKQCFLEMLTAEMNTVGMCAMQSGGDADTLIATTAVDIANSKPTVITGEDADLLILLTHFVNKKKVQNDVFFMSDKNVKGESKVWSIGFAYEQLGQCVCDGMLAIHALLGCDTTSRVFSISKGAALTKFQKDDLLSRIYFYSSKKMVQKQKLKKPEKDYWYLCMVEKRTTPWIRYVFINFTKRQLQITMWYNQSIYAQHQILQVSIYNNMRIVKGQ